MAATVRRGLVIRSSGAAIRTSTYEGRDHLVLPVVALVEGVIWPINAKTPELVLAEEFVIAPDGWNGRPVFCGHPVRGGTQVSGNTPEIHEQERIGWVFNTGISEANQLTMEAWLDHDRCVAIGGDALNTYERAERGEPIEISTGLLTLMEQKKGVYNGRPYSGIWRGIVPDHLALLPEGDIGACSIEMGCGVRAAASHYHLITEGLVAVEIRTARKIPQDERDKMPASDFAGKNRSFPIQQPVDVGDAAQAIGRAGPDNYDTDTLKANIIRIAYRKGASFVAELPNDWKKAKDQKASQSAEDAAAEEVAELVQWTTISTLLDQTETTIGESKAIVAQLIADETENPTETAAQEDAEETVENARLDALYALAGSAIDTLYKVLNLCSQCLMEDEGVDTPRYAKGARNSKIDSKTIQAVHDNAVALGAYCDPAAMKSNAAHDCGCKEKSNMDRKDRIAALMANKHSIVKEQKALEAMTDEGLAAVEAAAKASADAEAKAAADKEAETKAAKEAETKAAAAKNEPKELTEEEMLARMPGVKRIVEAHGAMVTAQKNDLIGKLKTAQSAYSEAELKTMELGQLQKIAKIAKLDEPTQAAAAVDYSGFGLPRAAAAAEEEVPAPPDMGAALRAMAGGKKENVA